MGFESPTQGVIAWDIQSAQTANVPVLLQILPYL